MVNGVISGWCLVTSKDQEGSILGPFLFDVFVNDLDVGIEGVLSKFADNTELGAAVHSIKGGETLQSNLDNLQQHEV